jgi:hypothetical protein
MQMELGICQYKKILAILCLTFVSGLQAEQTAINNYEGADKLTIRFKKIPVNIILLRHSTFPGRKSAQPNYSIVLSRNQMTPQIE